MDSTSVSMIQGLQRSSSDPAWDRLLRQYGPLLTFWAKRLGLKDQDAEDLVQEVLIVLVQKLADFQYQPERSFRGWMRTILINKWRDRRDRRAASSLEADVPFNEPGAPEALEADDHRQYVAERALRLMKSAFEPTTWKACWETIVGGQSPGQVASELGISVNAVYLAKSRVLDRLRYELKGLVD
jgi:RNA polymerase sigma-70 factor, ECF subfamily